MLRDVGVMVVLAVIACLVLGGLIGLIDDLMLQARRRRRL